LGNDQLENENANQLLDNSKFVKSDLLKIDSSNSGIKKLKLGGEYLIWYSLWKSCIKLNR
jgi:hypothetical protein